MVQSLQGPLQVLVLQPFHSLPADPLVLLLQLVLVDQRVPGDQQVLVVLRPLVVPRYLLVLESQGSQRDLQDQALRLLLRDLEYLCPLAVL